nr:hypothetical protein [Thermus thalpophilus]
MSAARIGAFDLAVGNVLGSHLFNALILAWHDLFTPRSFFQEVHESHPPALLVALAMEGVVLEGVSYQAVRKLAVMPWPLTSSGFFGFTPCGEAPPGRAWGFCAPPRGPRSPGARCQAPCGRGCP